MGKKRVLIVGGGFGGLAAALALEKQHIPELKITLVSNKSHFEYHAALYRVVTGKSPLEVCIPLSEVLQGKNIEFNIDTINKINLNEKIVQGASGSRYIFDYVIFALGSETAYFNIPGLEQFSFGFKSITEALRLKRHIHKLFEECSNSKDSSDEKVCLLHFVIVGAGASGVELAGELAQYTKELAKKHSADETLITIDLIEAASRILPTFPQPASEKIAKRLGQLGVNIFTNRSMVREEIEQITIKGITMKTETVIWTAGIKPNSLYQNIKGFTFDKKGKVLVDEYLQAKGFKNIFIIGDGASTHYSGMAQTAIHNGLSVADNIIRSIKNRSLKKYQPKKPFYSIPVGPNWAATIIGQFTFYGVMGWLFRRLADFRYFLSILPLSKTILAFRSGKTLCEACQICLPEE